MVKETQKKRNTNDTCKTLSSPHHRSCCFLSTVYHLENRLPGEVPLTRARKQTGSITIWHMISNVVQLGWVSQGEWNWDRPFQWSNIYLWRLAAFWLSMDLFGTIFDSICHKSFHTLVQNGTRKGICLISMFNILERLINAALESPF